MKAVFQRLGAVAWGHSVAGLLEELAQKLPVPEALLDAASELDKAYIPSRYPDALPEGAPFQRYRRGEAERLLGHAEAVYAYCEGVLSQMDGEELLLRLEEGLKALEKEVPLLGPGSSAPGPGEEPRWEATWTSSSSTRGPAGRTSTAWPERLSPAFP